MKLTHYLSILAISAMLASCSKEGPTGPQGPPGADGVANIYSQGYTVTSSDWSSSAPFTTWVASYSESDITDADNDAVEAYWSTSSSGWLALPVSSLIANNDELSYGYDNGLVSFSYYTGGSNQSPPSAYPGYTTIYFKVTVIPPSIQVKYPNVNWKNATEVAAKVPEIQAELKKGK